jgi:Melibiase
MTRNDDKRTRLTAGDLSIRVDDEKRGSLSLDDSAWPDFHLDGLKPKLRLDGQDWPAESARVVETAPNALTMEYAFQCAARLTLSVHVERGGLCIGFTLVNDDSDEKTLERVTLLATDQAAFGDPPEAVRVLKQGNYWGQVVSLAELTPAQGDASDGEPNTDGDQAKRASDLVSVVYSRSARRAFLAGYETSERWLGQIHLTSTSEGALTWGLWFDGGDLRVRPGETIALETVVLLSGPDPWALLEDYGDRVRERHNPQFPDTPPVSWCSWYPYRLGVTEERILENARIAAERLKPLGLSIVEVDLGWERDQLPSAFEENDQFSHGLRWLSEQLGELGFELGVWKAPFTLSEFDPLVKAHPDWLIQDEDGQPADYWTWFWKPHGKVFILDLTQPGAQDWLKGRMDSLRKRGVRYLKTDFIGCVSHALAKRRHDPRIVAGGGTEAGRIGARIMREALPDALLLNLGGPEMPGAGQTPLIYACNDTGNTGFITADCHRENYQGLACHLFKNKRWGIIQPSCLCVGLPGTIEEARLRATIAFMAGGQIDISDALATLPEDRWAVLTATLPPLGLTAKPVDLFDGVTGQREYGYVSSCKEDGETPEGLREHSPGSVWHLHVDAGWDAWDLVAVFSFDAFAADASPALSHYAIPLDMLGLSAEPRWGYEFWSGQFLGEVPGKRTNPHDYAHPGDIQDLVVGDDPNVLEVGFIGPGVKLLCLKAARPHPWVVGSSFHQSCGTELDAVAWDEATRTLRGTVWRPAGDTGDIVISPGEHKVTACEVDGQPSPIRPGANGTVVLPITMPGDSAPWEVLFEK